MHYCWLKILNVVQVFSPAQAVTVCYCCYCCSVASKQKMPKNPGKTRKYLGFPGYFRVLPALDAGDRRGSLPGLPYCCSAGLTLATVVGEPHCCSVVTVNTSNTVQLLTLGNPTHHTPWHSGEHSGLYKILFPIFACSSLVISARGHTPQASNHSAMRLLIWRDALTPSVARRCDTAEYRVQRSTSRSTPLAIITLRGGRAA